MRGMQFHGHGNGGLEVVEKPEKGAIFWSRACGGGTGSKRLKGGIREGLEPRSVLDNRRSPSPPTSSSTLSSSLGGGGGSSPTAAGGGGGGGGLAAVSDNPARKWVAPDSSAGEVGGGGGAARKEEWASDLQPVPAGLAVGEKCELGGVEDWETVFSAASAGADPGQDQTFLRWIMGDVDDPSARQHMLSHGPAEFDGGNGVLGFGLVDPGFGLDPIGGMGAVASVSASAISPPPPPLASSVSSDGGLSLGSTNVHNSGSRISPSPPSPGPKAPTFGNQSGNTLFSPLPTNSLIMSSSLLPGNGMLSQEPMEEKPQLFGPSLLAGQQQPASSPGFFLPLSSFTAPAEHQQLPQLLLPSQPKRHYSMVGDPTCQIPPKLPFPDPSGGPDLFLRRNQLPPQQTQGYPQLHPAPYHLPQRSVKPKVAAGDEAAAAAAVHHQQQRQALFDQLFEAAKLIEVGNFASARGILARLNHQLPAPLGRPLLRSAFYFKEALGRILADTPNPLSSSSSSSPPSASPFDVVLKLSAYKNFSEVSPVIQFTNFTCIQALLEELGGSARIHIVDFDIGIGGQWSSFIQELAQRRSTAAGVVSMLKITAFVTPCSHHPLQLHLTRENLAHFAADLGIPFEFSILSLDSFHPSELLGMGDEAIAVNLPVGSSHGASFPTILRLVKQLSPRIVVSVDQGCDRSDLPFSLHFLHSFQSCMVLLDSIDAAGADAEAASKIERYLLQARIESAVLGRYRAAEKMLPWRTLFASVGFVPVQISNYAETQAECLLKRVQVRGFHVEKRQASLFLYWQRAELVSVSAWRC